LKKRKGDNTKNFSYFEEFQPTLKDDQEFITYFLSREKVEDKFENDTKDVTLEEETGTTTTTGTKGPVKLEKAIASSPKDLSSTRRQKSTSITPLETLASGMSKRKGTTTTTATTGSSKGITTRRASLVSDTEDLSTPSKRPKRESRRR